MREILVAAFDTEQNANKAVQALEQSGVTASAIRRYHKDDPAVPQLSPSPAAAAGGSETYRPHQTSGGFWAWLMGEETDNTTVTEYEQHHPSYNRAIESGNTVIVVTVEETQAERVMTLLADQLPVQLEDVGPVMGAGAAIERTQQQNITGAGRVEERIPLAEEHVNIGKRQVEGTTTVRRYVVERPVEQQVNLHDERVEIERRPTETHQPVTGGAAFQERTVEVHTTHEEPVVNKTARVGEEVIVRKTGTDRTETVHDTVRKEEAEVENKPTSRAATTDPSLNRD
jgi:uncharacterized protein (TIGR02271 family)